MVRRLDSTLVNFLSETRSWFSLGPLACRGRLVWKRSSAERRKISQHSSNTFVERSMTSTRKLDVVAVGLKFHSGGFGHTWSVGLDPIDIDVMELFA